MQWEERSHVEMVLLVIILNLWKARMEYTFNSYTYVQCYLVKNAIKFLYLIKIMLYKICITEHYLRDHKRSGPGGRSRRYVWYCGFDIAKNTCILFMQIHVELRTPQCLRLRCVHGWLTII